METKTLQPRTWQVETLLERWRTCRFLTICWGISVRDPLYLGAYNYLKTCPPAQPLQAQIQAALPTLASALQQQGQSQPQQQQQPTPNANLNAINTAPVPHSGVPQQPTLAPTNPNANLPQHKNINQNVNGGSGPGFPAQNVQVPANGINNALVPTSAPGQAQPPTIPTICRLTGCAKPVYTDANSNHASEYCSMRHRE